MVETATSVSVSPVKFGNLDDSLNLPWFNRADAALFSSERHPNDECSLNVRLIRRKDTENTFDIVPCTTFGFGNLAARLLTIVLHPDSDTVPAFEIPYAESLSPSTTYVWRSGVLLPIIRHYFAKLVLAPGAMLILAFLLRHLSRKPADGAGERIRLVLEDPFWMACRVWSTVSAPIRKIAPFLIPTTLSRSIFVTGNGVDRQAREKMSSIVEENP